MMYQIRILRWVPVRSACSNWVLMVIAGCMNCLSPPQLFTAILHVVTFVLVTEMNLQWVVVIFYMHKIAIIMHTILCMWLQYTLSLMTLSYHS